MTNIYVVLKNTVDGYSKKGNSHSGKSNSFKITKILLKDQVTKP